MRQKIIEIVITALLSALIAVLQAWLAQIGGGHIPGASPIVASSLGAALAALKKTTA